MISDQKPDECYVYITLPGQTIPVTAGRFTLTLNRQGVQTGRFIYGKRYLARADAVALDPIELKLSAQAYETNALKGVFGAIRDASPDYWGRKVIERHAGKLQLNEIDYLLFSPDDRAGALGFGLNQTPPSPTFRFNQTIQLEKLQNMAEAIMRDDDSVCSHDKNQLEEWMLIGTSMGGARPKAVVEDQTGLWLAKFNRTDDPWDNACVEHAMLNLARACGLTSAESRVTNVAGRNVLLVKRFDRERINDGYLRLRMISALTLLRAEDTYQSRDKWSYVLFAEELRRSSNEPKKDAMELFRRMCFNALISNTDDHPRNHALIAKEQHWRLSPAYDLTVSTPVSIERRNLAMNCGDAGRAANISNLLSQSPRFLLQEDYAKQIINEMRNIVRSDWYKIARNSSVSEKDCQKIAGAFSYPGFDT